MVSLLVDQLAVICSSGALLTDRHAAHVITPSSGEWTSLITSQLILIAI